MSFKAEVTFIYFFHNGWEWLKMSYLRPHNLQFQFSFQEIFLHEQDTMAFVQNETFVRFSHSVLIYPLFRVRSVRIQFSVKLPSHLCCWHSSTRMIFGGWENHCVTANKSLFPRLFIHCSILLKLVNDEVVKIVTPIFCHQRCHNFF